MCITFRKRLNKLMHLGTARIVPNHWVAGDYIGELNKDGEAYGEGFFENEHNREWATFKNNLYHGLSKTPNVF